MNQSKINSNQLNYQQVENEFLSKNVLFNQFFNYAIFRDLYTAYIDRLPLYNPPDVLGLHVNADINYLTKTADEIYSNMLDIQPKQHEMKENSNKERKTANVFFFLINSI